MPKTAVSEVAAKVVGRSIRQARQEVGITQAVLAGRMGVNPSYVTNVEAGRVNLTVGQLANIAEALGTGLDVRLPVLDSEPIRFACSTVRQECGKARARTRIQDAKSQQQSHFLGKSG